MSDNFQANPGGGGDTFAADDIAGVKYPRSKIGFGADGEYFDVSTATPIPVIDDGASPLNQQFAENTATITTRAITEERLIAEGLFTGREIVNKFGRNGDVDTGALPEDVWNGGGAYAGFPTGSPEEFQVFSSNVGDTGFLTFTYLPSFTATAWLTATVTLNGTTPVNTGITGVRCHAARYDSNTDTTFNIGIITVRHRVTTANVFIVMPIGRSQSNVAAYTIPFGSRGYITRFAVRENSHQTGYAEGELWLREFGKSPRLRRPWSATGASPFFEEPYGGIQVPELTDIQVRISTATVNNMAITAAFDIIIAST